MIGRRAESGAPEGALYVVLAAAAATGFFDGVGQGALYGDASLLPPEYTHVSGVFFAFAGCFVRVLWFVLFAPCPQCVQTFLEPFPTTLLPPQKQQPTNNQINNRPWSAAPRRPAP
jgi:hypothetical protein